MKPTVYIETTIVSYLTAWQSRDLIVAGQQQVTREWWSSRSAYELYISELVLAEASEGDPAAASERLGAVRDLPVLRITAAAEQLASALVTELAIPPQAIRDAMHVAIASTNGVGILLTWNCRHLANLHQRGRIEQVCRDLGYQPPMIGTPNELREVEP